MAATQRLIPRRKFEVRDVIRNVLKSKQNKNDDWIVVQNKNLARKIANDLAHSNLWVYGRDFDFGSDITMQDLCNAFELLKPESYKKNKGERKLKFKPLFSSDNFRVNLNGLVLNKGRMSVKDLNLSYEKCCIQERKIEPYYPDGQAWIQFDSYNKSWINFQLVLELFVGFCAEGGILTAWPKLLSELRRPIYKHANVKFIYAALLHIMLRGVADVGFLKVASNWKRGSQEELISRAQQYMSGVPPTSLIAGYKSEIALQQFLILKELRLIRAPIKGYKVNESKFLSNSIYFSAWNEGVWRHLSEVHRYRLVSEISEPYLNEKNCRFTMFSGLAKGAGASFAAGATEEINKVIDDKINENSEKLHNQASSLMGEFFEKAQNLSASFWQDFSLRTESVLGNVKSDLSNVSSSLLTLEVFVKQIQSLMSKNLNSSKIFGGIELSPITILKALQYYLIYINVENKFIKALCFFMILESLGCISTVVSLIVKYLNLFLADEEQGEVDGRNASFTSFSDGFYKILECPTKILKVLSVVLLELGLSGRKVLERVDILVFLRKISVYAKEFHFIGGGILGIERIINGLSKLISIVSSFINTHIFGLTDPKRKLAREVLKWVLEVRYFSTERGLTAIRTSKGALERASKLFPRGQALLAQLSPASSLHDPKLYADLNRYMRESKLISNFITRRNAVTGFQPTMFHVQFVGRPGIGKSTITKRFVKDLIANLWKDSKPNDCWAYNPNLEFFDGYASQKIMIIDDMFRMNEPKHLTTLIGLVTNTPVVLPMANLEDKGIQLTSEILLSSTNTAYPRGKDILCMEAVHRRRHMLVHVECDPAVVSPSTGQFELALFNSQYPGQKLEDLPHLRFSLLQPVPQAADLEEIQNLDRSQFTALHAYAQKLKDVNEKILVGSKEIDPMVYFSASRAPPSPLVLPCKNWTYQELVSNSVVRYTAFRGMEGRYSKQEKYQHVESSLAEIDMMIDQSPDLVHLPMEAGDIADSAARTRLISGFLESEFAMMDEPYPVTDLAEDLVGDDDLCPEIAELDIDNIISEFLGSETSSDSFEVVDEPNISFTSDELTLTEEQKRRNAILRRKGKKVQSYESQNQIEMQFRDGRYYLTTNSSPVVWDELKSTQFNPTYSGSVQEWVQMVEVFKAINSKAFNIPKQVSQEKILNFLSSLEMNAYMTIPNTKLFKPEHRGKKFNMPIELLRRVKVIKNQVVLDVTDLEPIYHFDQSKVIKKIHYCESCLENGNLPYGGVELGAACDWCPISDSVGGCRWFEEEIPAEIVLHRNGKSFKVVPSIGLLFGSFGIYSAFCSGLEMFTIEQIEVLVQLAQYRNKYTGFYTLSGFKKQLQESFAELACYSKSMLVSVSDYIISNLKPYIPFLLSTVALITVIYLCKGIASVFLPKTKETSKYLHRGPQSSIIRHGRFTSLFNNPRFENLFGGILRRNLCEIEISDGYKTARCHALLSGQNIVFNKHSLRQLDVNSAEIKIFYNLEDVKIVQINPTDLYQDPNGDLAIFWSRNLQSARSIARYLIPQSKYSVLEMKSDVFVLSREGDNFAVSQNSPYKTVQRLEFNAKSGAVVMDQALLIRGSTVVGKSGSPVFLANEVLGSPAMLGIQAWEIDNGFSSSIAVQVITKEKFDDLVSRVDKSVVVRIEDLEFEELDEISAAFTSQNFNNVICRTENPAVGQIGKTQFKRTPISDLMDEAQIASGSVPASLHAGDKLLAFGRDIHPLKHSLAKFNRGQVKPLNYKILDYIRKSLVQDFKSKLDKTHFRKMEFQEIFTGNHEDGSNPMNLKSSPGIPYLWEKVPGLKGKHSLVDIDEEGNVCFVAESLKDDYANFKANLSSGQLPLTISYDFPKDELRPFEKARGSVSKNTPPKTRTVTCMNMLYIMLWRELTLDLWASFHRLADGTFPLCPGINPEGPEWNNAFHYLNEFPHALDFDVSNWDGFLPPELLFAAGDIICEILNYKQGSPEYSQLHGILFEVMFGYVQFDKFIYQKQRGMISGFPGTAEMNSLCHYILILYIYLNAMQYNTQLCTYAAFLAYIRFLVYGDDIILTISPLLIEHFSGLDIWKGYTDIGYTVTSADKTVNVIKYKTLGECQFLKSDWKELLPGYYVRRMNLDVAINLVYWVRAKEQPTEQFLLNVHDSLRIIFGHGERVFDWWVLTLNKMLKSVGLPIITYTYMDLYDDYIHRYINL